MKIKSKEIAIVILIFTAIAFAGCSTEGTTALSPGDKVTFTVDSVSFTMVYIPGMSFKTGADDGGTAAVDNPYWIGETEVTYELWYAVRDWAENTASPAYTFANDGREGYGGTIGDEPTNQEPATTINWRDAMLWCNAATEWYNAKNGTSYTCAYYTDAAYNTPIRSVDDTGSITYPDPGGQDDPYVNPDATGFRMLSSDEWELAARYIDDANGNGNIEDSGEFYPGNYASGADAQYDATMGGSDIDGDSDIEYSADVAVFDVGSTAIVKSKSPNRMDLYDMSGNIWEWCFDWYTAGFYRVVRGGSCTYLANDLQVGSVGSYNTYDEINDIGFRLAMNK
jgi:formylglycine-generating enzyme required for sulfatase activity